jgi:hypothetical protein
MKNKETKIRIIFESLEHHGPAGTCYFHDIEVPDELEGVTAWLNDMIAFGLAAYQIAQITLDYKSFEFDQKPDHEIWICGKDEGDIHIKPGYQLTANIPCTNLIRRKTFS